MTVRCRRPGDPPDPGPAGHPEVLGQPDQHRSHQERLVAVVTDVLDLQHGVGAEQRAEVELVAALEEPAGGPEPQAGQPHLDEAEHVVGDPLAVADLPDDPDRGPLQVGQARVAGIGVRRDRLAQRQVPARVLVHPGQRRAEHLGEGLVRPEGRDEQRLDQVGVGLQREPAAFAVRRGLERVEAGRDRVRLTRPDPNDLGDRRPGTRSSRPGGAGSGQPRRHQPVLGLGRLHHQPRDPGRGGGLEQRPHGLRFPRSGRAADEHVPVQRVQRQRQRPGRAAVPVQDLADGDRRPAGRGLLGHVEIGPQRQPDARHLALGRPGQRGHQLTARAERVTRHRVAAGRRRPGQVFERLRRPRAALTLCWLVSPGGTHPPGPPWGSPPIPPVLWSGAIA